MGLQQELLVLGCLCGEGFALFFYFGELGARLFYLFVVLFIIFQEVEGLCLFLSYIQKRGLFCLKKFHFVLQSTDSVLLLND